MATIDRILLTAVGPDVLRTTWAEMPPQYMTMTIAQVWDSDGHEGVGVTQTFAAGGFDTSVLQAAPALARAILGRDAADREARWRDLQTNVTRSPAGVVAILDNAIWDLAAKRANLPLYRLLGGRVPSLDAYASTEQLDSVGAYLDLVEKLSVEGFRAVKFHAWNDPDRDLEMVRSVSDRFNGISFMHDAENRYDRHSAIKVARELDDLGFRWFEAPLIDYDVEGYQEIRRHVSIPLVPHGLWIDDIQELLAFLKQRPWDAVRFDASSALGITHCRRLCALADAFGIPAEPQSWGYSPAQFVNLHLGLSVANASYFELPVPYEAYEFGVTNPIRIDREGKVFPPDLPGTGFVLDWEQINAARLDSKELRI